MAGKDIYDAVLHVIESRELDRTKLSEMNAGGVPAKIGDRIGMASLVSTKVAEHGGKLYKLHCIFRQ